MFQDIMEEVRRCIKEIPPEEVYQALQKKTLVLLDVREKEEYERGHIEGALNIPRSHFEMTVERAVPDKKTPVVLHCQSGMRALLAAKAMQELGYRNVSNMAGGFQGWVQRGSLPVERPLEKEGEGASEKLQERYSRHVLLPEIGEKGQRQLLQSRVVVVGAGGLGCPALYYLTAAGVGTLGIVDFDRVDVSNLQRQILHQNAFVGRPKVESAYYALKSYNPDVHLKTYPERLSKDNVLDIFKDYDVVLDGSDNFRTRYLINNACIFLNKPYVHGSIFRFEGQVTTFVPKEGPCYQCIYPTPPSANVAPNCQEAGVLGILPGIIGLLQAMEVIKLLLGIGDPLVGKLLTYDALKTEFRTYQVPRNKHCTTCSKTPSLKEWIEVDEILPLCNAITP